MSCLVVSAVVSVFCFAICFGLLWFYSWFCFLVDVAGRFSYAGLFWDFPL